MYIDNCVGKNNINFYMRGFLIYTFTNFVFFLRFTYEIQFGKKLAGFEGMESFLQVLFAPMMFLTQMTGIYSPFSNLGWVAHDLVLWSLTAFFTAYPLMNVDSVY